MIRIYFFFLMTFFSASGRRSLRLLVHVWSAVAGPKLDSVSDHSVVDDRGVKPKGMRGSHDPISYARVFHTPYSPFSHGT